MATIRKNITLPVDVYEAINAYAKRSGVSFSEFLRDTAMKAISKQEDASLLDYMQAKIFYVDREEQKEIEDLNIDFDNLDGKEITLDEFLQG